MKPIIVVNEAASELINRVARIIGDLPESEKMRVQSFSVQNYYAISSQLTTATVILPNGDKLTISLEEQNK